MRSWENLEAELSQGSVCLNLRSLHPPLASFCQSSRPTCRNDESCEQGESASEPLPGQILLPCSCLCHLAKDRPGCIYLQSQGNRGLVFQQFYLSFLELETKICLEFLLGIRMGVFGSKRGRKATNKKTISDGIMMRILPCVVAAMDKFTRTTSPVEEKGRQGHSFQEERALTPASTGFYCFSGHITLRMILSYYAQVLFRRLQKTKERMLLIT